MGRLQLAVPVPLAVSFVASSRVFWLAQVPVKSLPFQHWPGLPFWSMRTKTELIPWPPVPLSVAVPVTAPVASQLVAP